MKWRRGVARFDLAPHARADIGNKEAERSIRKKPEKNISSLDLRDHEVRGYALRSPASGVMVSAVELSKGFRTFSIEFVVDVVTSDIPTIWLVPVARPTTV